MATLSNPTYYAGGTQWTSGDGGYVGYGGYPSSSDTFPNLGGNYTRIVRYTLTTGPSDHASKIKIQLFSNDFLSWAGGNSKVDTLKEVLSKINGSIDLYFKIGTSPTEHVGAGRDYYKNGNYDGQAYIQSYFKNDSSATQKLENLRFHIELNADYAIAPNSTYYVWIFPGFGYVDGTYGLFRWDDRNGDSYKFTRQVTLTEAHSYTSKVTAPTCTAQGYTTYTCACGHSYKGNYTAATGHTPVNGGTASVHTKCKTCGVTISSTHSYTSSRIKEPTCTAKGTTKYSCSCGYAYSADDVPALGHNEVYGGTVGVHTKCSRCNTTLSTTHVYVETTLNNPTCTTDGTRKQSCACGYNYTDAIPALGHAYGAGVEIVKPTYSSEGTMQYTCTRCGTSYTTSIPKLQLDSVVYIDTCVSTIPNPGPFATADSWLPNQNATISLNGNNLKVVSNQSSSTPGAYTSLDGTIPAGDKVTLTYTIKGNVHVAAYLWNESAGTGVLNTDYKHLTEEFQTFTLTGTVNNIVDKLYFFMVSPTTSSWFEIKDIQLTCSTTTFKPYQVFIDNGSGWDLYMAYIDNGSGWDACG